ncbi:hypothetical protein [Bifidobacterium jacchi]|nr:hypothetical protein [Bifidobacterium jacchi]
MRLRWDVVSVVLTAAMFLLQLIDFIIDKLDRRRRPKHRRTKK